MIWQPAPWSNARVTTERSEEHPGIDRVTDHRTGTRHYRLTEEHRRLGADAQKFWTVDTAETARDRG